MRCLPAPLFAVIALAACGPLIGLDGLHGRAALTVANDAGDAGVSDAGPSGAPECVTHADCNNADAGTARALCVSGQCKTVDPNLCLPDVLPTNDVLNDPSPFLIAAFVPIEDGLQDFNPIVADTPLPSKSSTRSAASRARAYEDASRDAPPARPTRTAPRTH